MRKISTSYRNLSLQNIITLPFSSQRSALNCLFGPGDPARNIWGFPELELWFLNKHLMYVPGPAPIPVWQEPPPVDEVYADGIESVVGQLQIPTQDALQAAREAYEQAISQAFLAGEGRAPTPKEARVVATGLPLFERAYPGVKFGS